MTRKGSVITSQGNAPMTLQPRHARFAERYVALGTASKAYQEVFRTGKSTRTAGIAQKAWELRHRPDVAERIRQLQAEAAANATISIHARMLWLQSILDADISEVARIETRPCSGCTPTGKPPLEKPRATCPTCHGRGVQHLAITDTEKLSAPARALVKAIRRRSDGSVEVVFHNRLDASDQLNRMQGVYVDRSVSLNLNADIKPLPKGMSIEEALAIMESVSPTQDALPSPTSSVVSEQ